MRDFNADIATWAAGSVIALIVGLTLFGLEMTASKIVAEKAVREALNEPDIPLRSVTLARGPGHRTGLVCGVIGGDASRRFAVVLRPGRGDYASLAFLTGTLRASRVIVPELATPRQYLDLEALRLCDRAA